MHERYGPERSALVASFATYRARGAIRDLGKALGLPPGEVERLARAVDVYEASRDAWERMKETLGKLRARSPRWRALGELLPEIAGLPPHLPASGGMVISTTQLVELCSPTGGDGGPADRSVGQGLVRGRRLPEDRPAGAGDALCGRALRG